MNKLTEKDFALEKEQVLNGRLTMSGMRVYLIGVLFYSGLLVGLSFAIANANTVGWDTLSRFWHILFYIEAVSFGYLILILTFCWGESAFNQKLISVGVVLFSYKIALEPFLMILMLSKDRGTYNSFLPLVLLVIVSGLFLHILFLNKWIKGLKREKLHEDNSIKSKKNKSMLMVPIVFLLSTITGIVIKNGLLGESELFVIVVIATIVYIPLLFAVCELIIVTYCIFRFPSFSVNAPKRKNAQHLNTKKKKKKKRKGR